MATLNNTEINIRTEFSKSLLELFRKAFGISDILRRGFATSEKIKKGSILFVGLNPSFTLANEPNEPEEIFYNLSQQDNYKYFKRFEEISESTGIAWEHIDMLTIRETNQNNVISLARKSEGLDFIWKHLLLTKDILEQTEPKVIVVANTVARTYLGKDVEPNGNNKWLGYLFEFDETIGTHRITNRDSSLLEIPVFFTSMMTGQRAMDNGSYERLKWHINWVLHNRNLPQHIAD